MLSGKLGLCFGCPWTDDLRLLLFTSLLHISGKSGLRGFSDSSAAVSVVVVVEVTAAAVVV